MKLKIITICGLGASLMISPLLAQQGPGGPPEDRPGRPDLQRPEVPENVRNQAEELHTLRQELRESRQATMQDLGVDATPGERREAIVSWQTENADKLAAAQDLSDQIRDSIRENRPVRPTLPERPEVPQEIIDLRQQAQLLQGDVAAARAALVTELRESGATEEEVRSAMAAFREEFAEVIQQVQALNREVAAWFQANRPERPDRPANTGLDQRRANFAAEAQQMRQARAELNQQLRGPGVDPAERRELIEAFRQEQRLRMEELKEIRRQERLENGDNLGGDRRPGG